MGVPFFHLATSSRKPVASAPFSRELRRADISQLPARRLRQSEVYRRIWHMLPGTLPFLMNLVDVPRPLPWAALRPIACIAVVLTWAVTTETKWRSDFFHFSFERCSD